MLEIISPAPSRVQERLCRALPRGFVALTRGINALGTATVHGLPPMTSRKERSLRPLAPAYKRRRTRATIASVLILAAQATQSTRALHQPLLIFVHPCLLFPARPPNLAHGRRL